MMKVLLTLLLFLAVVVSLSGCGQGQTSKESQASAHHENKGHDHGEDAHDHAAPEANGNDDHAGHDHAAEGHGHGGERYDLGTRAIGSFSVKAAQLGPLEPGQEAVFELVFADPTTAPETVRVWVGNEAAEGAVKVKAERIEPGVFDAHVEAAAQLPENAQVWVEVQLATGERVRGAFAPKR